MSAIRLGTRASTLATTQSEMVAGLLRSEGLDVNLTTITTCLLYTSDAADEGFGVDRGGRRLIKK